MIGAVFSPGGYVAKLLTCIFALVALGANAANFATASPKNRDNVQVAIFTPSEGPIGGKIGFGDVTAIPTGYYEMCAGHPDICQQRRGRLAIMRDGSVRTFPEALAQLSAANSEVNAAIHPAHRDGWMPGRTVGDCKDFTLTKRQHLLEAGWPSSALNIAIVRISTGEQHMILVARTDRGDYVLDNLRAEVTPLNEISYSWEKVQSWRDGLTWDKVQ